MTRFCECGCGEVLNGSYRKRFLDDAHRMRAARSGNGHHGAPEQRPEQEAEQGEQPEQLQPPPVTPGRCREGLETWLTAVEGAPPALVEHARLLADEVDEQPHHSPLHGRYSTALMALIEAVSIEADRETSALLFRFDTGCEVPAHSLCRGVHCAACCAASDGLGEVASWQPPSRQEMTGYSHGQPTREVDDVEYGRACVAAFLRRKRVPAGRTG